MKRFYTLCVLLLILSSLLLSAHTQANGVENEPPDPATWMPDANLRKAVRAALRLNANEPLTQEKMLNLHGLNAPKLGIRDLTGLESAMYLKSLLIGGNQIRNLKPLANLGNLNRLYIGDNRIQNIRHLVNLTNLRRLGMLRNQVTDISVLVGLVNLEYLRLAGNPITDTSPLENLPNLSDVDIEIPSLIPDPNLRTAVRAALGIAPNLRITIDAMRRLTTLSATQIGIVDLTGLEYATNLRSLSVGRNQIRNLKPLANLGNLRRLYIGDNRISNINPLANLTNLRQLGMLRNQVTDISVLAGLVNLKYLRLAGNPITDTSPLENLPNLSDVDIEIPSLIPDPNLRAAVRTALGIAPNLRITIDAMRRLTTLNAVQLGIADLTGLEYATNLTHLYIGDNLISDINPLAHLTNLRRLEMLRNQVINISVLESLVNLEYLRLAGNPITDTSPLRSLPKLIDVDVYISSPPQQENTQPQGESTHFDIAPPQDDGQQKDDRGQDDSGQSQQQSENREEEEDEDEEEEEEDEDEEESDWLTPELIDHIDCGEIFCILPGCFIETLPCEKEPECISEEQEDGSIIKICAPCTRPMILVCPEAAGEAPSHRKNAFILDRITLEQLDPATLEAQLDSWLTESNGSPLYLRSIALLESVLATRYPDKTHLLPNYPNPFNPETWIPYHLANPSEVQITIYDTRGTVVRHLDLGHQQAGYYTSRSRAVYWDGCNDIGEKVSSDIYFYQLQTDKTSQLRKMVILK